jgi:hypothetical protein
MAAARRTLRKISMSDAWAVPTFFAIKYLGYSAYCYGGLAWFQRSVTRPWLRSFGFALLRMGMGVGLGLALSFYFSRSHVYTNRLGIPEWFGSWVWTYVISYGLLRYLEWSVMAYLVSGRNAPFGRRAIPWTFGGVLLSFFTDWIGFATAIRIIGGIC